MNEPLARKNALLGTEVHVATGLPGSCPLIVLCDLRHRFLFRSTVHHIAGEQTNVDAWGIDRSDQRSGTNQVYRWRDDADGTGVEVYVLDTCVLLAVLPSVG